MSTQVQRRKGTTAQHASFTGASAELTVDTTKNTVVVHDGATAGGIPLAKETGSALSVTSLVSSGASVIEATSSNAALRITQLGSGNALLVEDSANPDSTPFVINAVGATILGYTATIATQNYAGIALANTQFQLHGAAGSTAAAAVFNWASSASSPASFIFNKSISNTIGTRGALTATNTDIGALSFNGDDGTNFIPAAAILAEVDGTPGTNDMPGRLIFSTTADGASTPTERMRIASNGDVSLAGGTANAVAFLNGSKVLTTGTALTFDGTNLGVGMSSPQARLQVLDLLKISNAGQSSGALALGDGSTTTFGVGLARWNGATNTAGAGGMGYFAQGPSNSGGHFWYTGDAAVGSTTKQMTLDTSGNLGLGVTPSAWATPFKNIQVGNGAGFSGRTDAMTTYMSSNYYYNVGDKYIGTGNATLYIQGSGAHTWYNAPSGTAGNAITFTQAMTLDASGNLLVGQTSSNFSGNIFSPRGKVEHSINTFNNGDIWARFMSGTAGAMTTRGSIDTNGIVLSYSVSSDRRLKENIVDAPSSINLLNSIKVRSFNWKENGAFQQYGFIAQELQEAEPLAVTGAETDNSTMGVDMAKLVPHLVKAIQEQQALIESLTQRLAAAGI